MKGFVGGLLAGILLVLILWSLIVYTDAPDVLVGPLLRPDTAGRADAIVVLGAGVDVACEPNLSALRRTFLAVRLFREGRAPVVLFTGGPGRAGGPCSSGESMAALARDLGLPPSAVLVEAKSQSTWENTIGSEPILRARGASRVLLVTDALHMPRAEACFRSRGFGVERASVRCTSTYPNNLYMLRAAVHEVLGWWYYRLRGFVRKEDR